MAGSIKTQGIRLVLLPGMDGTGELFADFVNALPQSFETVRVRYPTDRCLTYSELEDFVQAACPVLEPFMLIAESFSTPLAITFAATNPFGLAGVILCAGFATSPVKGWRRFLGALLAPLLFRVPLSNLATRVWLLGKDAPSLLVAAVQLAVSSVRPEVLAGRLRALLGCDVQRELGQITVPVLYLQAKQDHLVSASCLQVIRWCKPDITVTALEGPHLLLQRHPLRAAEAVVEFARRVLQEPATLT
jgi:pimeloyl-ACP methyl ester carboxylesterase